MNPYLKLFAATAFTISSTQLIAAVSTIKQKLEKEGFSFVKQIEAPAQMTGWAGHMQQNPMTVSISNDNKYYIVGDLHNAKGDNLTVDALNKHVKQSVLDDVWKNWLGFRMEMLKHHGLSMYSQIRIAFIAMFSGKKSARM